MGLTALSIALKDAESEISQALLKYVQDKGLDIKPHVRFLSVLELPGAKFLRCAFLIRISSH
jgi:hypothetical protein